MFAVLEFILPSFQLENSPLYLNVCSTECHFLLFVPIMHSCTYVMLHLKIL